MTSYISLPTYSSNIDERLRMIAGKCNQCGTLAYPQRPICIKCGQDKFERVPLSGEGKIYTYSVVNGGGAPSEFDEEQTMTGDVYCGIVELKEGPRVMVRFTDINPDQFKIGMKVKAVVRRLYDQEGFLRYGAKFTQVAQRM